MPESRSVVECPRCQRELCRRAAREVLCCAQCGGLLATDVELERSLWAAEPQREAFPETSPDQGARMVAFAMAELRGAKPDSGQACPACRAPLAAWPWARALPGWYCPGSRHLWLDGRAVIALLRTFFPEGEPPVQGRLSYLARVIRDLRAS